MNFTHAITRLPAESLIHGITTSSHLGKPDLSIAQSQHQDYISTLENCGLNVTVLPTDNDFPDSCFIEDPAVVTKEFILFTYSGSELRREESARLEKDYSHTEGAATYKIKAPGFLDGGDVLQIGKQFFVGITARTNEEGVEQFKSFVSQHGYHAQSVRVKDMLHLKTGISALDANTLLITKSLSDLPEFKNFKHIIIDDNEAYAANAIAVNGHIIIPQGYIKTQKTLENHGYKVITVNMSEFQKLDGGLSCLSLRY